MCGISVRPSKYGTESQIAYRGPDITKIKQVEDYTFIFHRLAIVDTSHAGDQPFEDERWVMLCNGEIFNYKQLKQTYTDYAYISHSDCETIIPVLENHRLVEACNILDGEFAFVAYDKRHQRVIAARDAMGIRPLFYGYTAENQIAFASEMKDLIAFCEKVYPFPPGHYYNGEGIKPFCELYRLPGGKQYDMDKILVNIRNILTASVVKRLDADVPVGYLLSGGLDSSLVCAIAQKHTVKPITTFAIGLDYNPIDLKYAKQVADYLGTDHHEVIFTQQDIKNVLRTIIWHAETWDVTTVRASTPMYLLCKYIRENSDIRVVLSGEVSDELFGYKYTDYAPSAIEFQKESQKRIKELYMYDVLRADRCIAGNSLEARVPFSDKQFVTYVMEIEPELKLNTYNMGKYLLRKAFDGTDYLPAEILFRDKAAFSDAVGHGLVDCLIELAEAKYTDAEFAAGAAKYKDNPPLTKEGLMYREIFNEMFPNQDHVICGYWLPNREWPNCDLDDPSARHLPNYGASGE
jgi:asparagine synthase (glutamine-hydrolysing)